MVQDAAWASLVGALYGGVILVGFALELGATPFIIGLLGAIPAIGAPAFKAADGSNSPTALVPPRPCVLPCWQRCNTLPGMKTLTVRLPEPLAAAIEAESRGRKISKSDVVRERLERASAGSRGAPAPPQAIADLIGSVDGLPAGLSARKKRYLRVTGYGRKRPR
jgi:hypothetical protein